MRRLKWVALVLVAIAAVIGGAGCAGDDDDGSAANADTTATAEGGGSATSTTATENDADEMEGEGSGTPAVESPAADLRLTLGRLLGEHAMLAMLATQKGFAGDADFKAIGAALDENSVDLSEAIASGAAVLRALALVMHRPANAIAWLPTAWMLGAAR